MSLKRMALLGMALLLVPGTARAQNAPGVEAGAYGKYTFFDDALPLDDHLGVGGRLGFYFLRNLMVEADISRTETDGPMASRVTYTPIHARLIYAVPLHERVSFLLGGGYTRNEFGAGFTDENGIGGLAGLRFGFSENVALRVDGSADYMPDPASGTDNALNWGVQAGLSFILARRGPRDSDGDGVMDPNDACPGTALGEAVDARGCPLPKDSDGDGVIDPNDACPDTPAGQQVDARGCPVLFEEGRRELVLEGVNFEVNSAELTASARGILDRVAESLVANPEVRVEVAGHTDKTGARAYNLTLSQRRAESVRNYLIQRGVAAGQVAARGYGPDNPIATNATRAGRAQNRRVELRKLN